MPSWTAETFHGPDSEVERLTAELEAVREALRLTRRAEQGALETEVASAFTEASGDELAAALARADAAVENYNRAKAALLSAEHEVTAAGRAVGYWLNTHNHPEDGMPRFGGGGPQVRPDGGEVRPVYSGNDIDHTASAIAVIENAHDVVKLGRVHFRWKGIGRQNPNHPNNQADKKVTA